MKKKRTKKAVIKASETSVNENKVFDSAETNKPTKKAKVKKQQEKDFEQEDRRAYILYQKANGIQENSDGYYHFRVSIRKPIFTLYIYIIVGLLLSSTLMAFRSRQN